MPFRVKNFHEHVIRLVKGRVRERLMDACGGYDGLSGQGQRTVAIRNMMEVLDRNVALRTRKELMESCGRQCIGSSILKKALRLTAQAHDLDELLVRLNEANIGGGNLRREGDIIYAEYYRCYCGSVSRTRLRFSPTYCYCSCGWYRQLFETVLKKPVRVELLESIIQGDSRCWFKIYVSVKRSPRE